MKRPTPEEPGDPRARDRYPSCRFESPWWLPGAHAQTLAGRFLRRRDRGPFAVERLELPDGDFLDIEETPSRLPSDAPIVVALHGLEGCARSSYLAAGARRLEERRVGRLYSEHFLRKLRAKASAKRALIRDRCDVKAAVAARTIREFDDFATAQLYGFADAADYYERSSSSGWLERIRVPTLLIHALDDPFLPAEAVPREAIRRNPWLHDGVMEQGGHVGFVGGTPWRPYFFAEREAASFLAEHLGGRSEADRCRAGAREERIVSSGGRG